ncbi:protein of unknown function [Burkholderia multivorans]
MLARGELSGTGYDRYMTMAESTFSKKETVYFGTKILKFSEILPLTSVRNVPGPLQYNANHVARPGVMHTFFRAPMHRMICITP